MLGIDQQTDQAHHAPVEDDGEFGFPVPRRRHRPRDGMFGPPTVIRTQVELCPFGVACICEYVVDVRHPEGPEQEPLCRKLGWSGHGVFSCELVVAIRPVGKEEGGFETNCSN